MIVVLQLSTHASQSSLLNISLLIQILRPWQSAKGVNKWIEAIEAELNSIKKKKMLTLTYTSQNLSC
jgi:hypothetical protein